MSKELDTSGLECRSFRPYSEYKESGVEWLGNIPTGWEIMPLKYAANLAKDRIEGNASEIPYVGLEHIESLTGKMVSAAEYGPSEGREVEELYTCFRSGDVLFGKLRPYLAKVLLSSFDGRCSSELLVLRSWGKINPPFLAYQLLSPGFIAWINAMTYGTKMPRASPDQVMSTPVAIPDADEQSAISAFLDRETAKIDALIEKKDRLIELLQEKRTALITQAVTKGLDPTIPMKDSGVEWLGEIPAHWGLRRLERIVEFRGGGTPSKDNLDYWCGDIPWVSPKDMKVSVVVDTEDNITPQAVRESATKSVPAGAVLLVVRSGILVHSIPVALSGRNVTLNQDLKALIPRSEILSEYLLYLIMGMQRELLVEWKKEGATVESLEMDLVAQTQIPLPNEAEQRSIVLSLDSETAKIDALIARIRVAITSLKEYRTALISSAVSGKIDVRCENPENSIELKS